MVAIEHVLHSWNGAPGRHLAEVLVEDDTLRDGLQGAFVRRPTVTEKTELLELAAGLGVQFAMLGFPGSSPQELADCATLVAAVDGGRLPVTPRFLARAERRDLEPIVKLDGGAACDVWADFFIGVSPLRRYVERWSFDDLRAKIAD
ncbi:MAG TPA: hypothetical protein VFX28_01615, partial [Methylomirabilota bacterium]|nr:hypothetical protein [Methylomirabilota bacterium]